MSSTTLFDFARISPSTESLLEYDGITTNDIRIFQNDIIESILTQLQDDNVVSIYYNNDKIIEFDRYQITYMSSYVLNRGWLLESIYNILNDEDFSTRRCYITFGHNEICNMLMKELLQIANVTNQPMKILVKE